MKGLTRFSFANDSVGVNMTVAGVGGVDQSLWSPRNAVSATFVPRIGDENIMPIQKRYGELLINAAATDICVSWFMVDRAINSRNIKCITALLCPYSTAQTAHIYARGAGFTTSITDWYRIKLDISTSTTTASLKIEKKIASGAPVDITPSATTVTVDLTKCYSFVFIVYDVYIKVKMWESSLPEPTTFLLNFIDTSLAGVINCWAGFGGAHSSITTSVVSFNHFGASTQADNKLLYGETQSNAVWTKLGTMAATQPAISAPDGSVGCSLLSTTVSGDSLYQDVAGISGTSTMAGSLYVLTGSTVTNAVFSLNWITGGAASKVSITYNPQTGAIISSAATGAAVLISATVEVSTYGWVRFKLAGTGTDVLNTAFRYQVSNNAAGAVSQRIWGCRLDAGGIFLPYYPDLNLPITNNDYLLWLNDMTKARVALVEISTTGNSNVTTDYTKSVTYYSSDSGFVSKDVDYPKRRNYVERIGKLPTFGRSLGIALTGKGQLSSGSIIFKNPQSVSGSGGIYDFLLRAKLKKEPMRLLYGDESWALFDFRPLLIGRVGQPIVDVEGEISVPVYDYSDKLADVFQNNVYTTAGQAINKPKPYLSGVADYIECVQYDTANPLNWQFHDGAVGTNVDKSSWVYDSAVSLVTPTLSVTSVAANVITLNANHGLLVNSRVIWPTGQTPPTGAVAATEYWLLTTPAGNTLTLSATRGGATLALTNTTGIGSQLNGFTFDINLTTGIITLVSAAAGRIVLRPLVNQNVTLVGKTLGQLYSDIVFTKYALPLNFKDTTSFAALDALTFNSQTMSGGVFFDSNQRSVLDCCDYVSKYSNSWYNWTNDTLMQVGLLALPSGTPVMSFTIDDLEGGSLKQPSKILPVDFTKAQVTYLQRNFSGGIFQTGDVTFRSLKDYIPKLAAQTATTPIDNATQGDSKNPSTYDSLFSDLARAIAYQTYLSAFFGKQIGIFVFRTRLAATKLNIGQTIRLTHELEGWKTWSAENPASPDNTGYYDSTLAVVIGIDTDLSIESAFKVTLTVYRQVPMYAPSTGEDLPVPVLDIDLSTSLVPTIGTQVAMPTFTRASITMTRDFEGIYKYNKTGEATFYGARRVENLVATATDFYTWTNNSLLAKSYDTNLSPYYPLINRNAAVLIEAAASAVHGVTYVATKATSDVRQFASRVHYLPTKSDRKNLLMDIGDGGVSNYSSMHVATTFGQHYVDSYGNQGAGFSSPSAVAVTTSLRGWDFLAMTVPTTPVGANISLQIQTSNSNGSGGAYLGDGASSTIVWGAQLEDVTGQTNKSPSAFIETDALYPNEILNSENPAASNWNTVGNSTTAITAGPDGSLTAARITLGSNWVSAAFPYRITGQRATTSQRGTRFKTSLWVRKNFGTGTQLGADVCDTSGGGAVQTITGLWVEYFWNHTSPVSPGQFFLDLNLGAGWTAGDTIDIWHPTVLADPDNVLTVSHSLTGPALPFFGAMVDGVKNFKYKNGNALSTTPIPYGTFTEAQGAVISRSTLLGAITEPGASNLLTAAQYRDFSNVAWVKTNVTVGLGTGLGIDGVDLTAFNTKLTSTAINSTVTLTPGLASNPRTYSLYIKRVTGVGNITLTLDNFATSNIVINPTDTTTLVRFQVPIGNLVPIIGIKFAANADVVVCDWGQLEDSPNAWASSPIIGGATRALTLLSYPTTRLPVVDFTFVVEWTNINAVQNQYVPISSYFDASNGLRVLQTNSQISFRRVVSAASFQNVFITTTAERLAGAHFRLVVRVSAADGSDAWLNGRRAASNTQTFAIPMGQKWELGSENGVSVTALAFSRFTIYKDLLSDDQCNDLST